MSAKNSYSSSNHRFAASPLEEAKILLKKVKRYGNVDPAPAAIPQPLASLIGNPVTFTADALTDHLAARGVSPENLGGPLDGPLSTAADGSGVSAKYFVIHDTSDASPGNPFPAKINTNDWSANNVAARSDKGKAHLFIGRTGKTVTGNRYSVRVLAVKFEKASYFPGSKGLFLHHELVQPRLNDPATAKQDDALAPTPGFTDIQYQRLALAYLAASLRKGSFLIPAYHCVIDEGIPDGHDDPQSFDLNKWASVLQEELNALSPAAENHFDALVRAYAAAPIAFPALKAVTMAQWMLESARGTSPLAQLHLNFGGLKFRPEMADFATSVAYTAHDGPDQYCKFADLERFVQGYWRFLERSPYDGWKNHTATPQDFFGFIGPIYTNGPTYVADVLNLLGEAETRLSAAATQLGLPEGAAPVMVRVDSPTDGLLNVRNRPKVTGSVVKATLTQDTVLARWQEAADAPGWWLISALSHDAAIVGYAHGSLLKPV